MNDSEYAAAIQDVCRQGATISSIKCFVESIRKDEREACASICDELHHTWRFGDGEDSVSGPKECASTIRERSNAIIQGPRSGPAGMEG